MDDGLTPSPRLRIFREDDSASREAGQSAAQPEPVSSVSRIGALTQPRLSTEEQKFFKLDHIATAVIASMNFGEKITCIVAPDNIGVKEVVDALNARWNKLTGRPHLLEEGVLKELLKVSPVLLQEARGSQLVLKAALSIDATENQNFAEQRRTLSINSLGVASPAATAIVSATLIIRAYENMRHGRDQLTASNYYDHLTSTAFRTEAVDPMTGHSLKHHNLVVRYDSQAGIICDEAGVGERSQKMWCAGSPEAFKPKTGLFDWLFGR